ncbi:predicted protein [Chaetomium globosum CBS 148.51]|uniref:Uncharacterized protein n=1 Tax=Chaetomium globosum (strain ATCC 6205 / CBS 148.51 / DSM 1962 / NBRC 6347 / NRRL 1970) TaxID=306901 RepID=Q2GRW6_CHAGB|nr:uncharacterized protein CHGG_09288 [Chaetomium globosum CBS 148.51]EAQ85274.1 predicted protein [Chaetomium globosum CBS 148.51]
MSARMAEPLKALQVEMEAPASSVRVQGIAKMMEARAADDAGLFDGGPHPASNPIPNRIKFYNSHLGPDPSPSTRSLLASRGHRAAWADAENKVFKTGAATGTTYGKLSTIQADFRFTREFPDAALVSFVSTGLVVVDETPDNRFASHGDSGAVIRDGRAKMLGVVWAGVGPGREDYGDLALIGASHWSLRLSTITLCLPMGPFLRAMKAEVDKALPGQNARLFPLPNSFGPGI